MFGVGYRTPAKGPETIKSPEGMNKNMTTPERRSPTPLGDSRAPSKPKQKALSQDSAKPIRKMTIEAEEGPSETPKYSTKTAEAKACLIKAKLHLGNSRNLKTDIKAEVTQVIERLYTLVKEAEAELEKRRIQPTNTSLPRKKGPRDIGAEGPQAEPKEITGDKLIERLQRHEELLKENSEAMERLKSVLANKGTEATLPYTYAAAAAAGAKIRFPQPALLQSVHSVVVSSADAHDTSEDVINKIRTAVSARTSGIRVDRLRKARDQKVVLGCRSMEEMTKVMDKLKADSPTLSIQKMENRDPLIIMFNVLNINTDEEVLSALKRQNSHLLGLIPEEDYRASVKFRRKARNPLESHVVLQVSPQVWKHLTEEGRAHIDLQRVVVKDQSPLVTCSRCLGYGHGRKTCQESVDTCSHCAGTHLRNACPALKAGEKPTCRNCQSARLDHTDHNSFDGECPIRRKWDALARSKVAYC